MEKYVGRLSLGFLCLLMPLSSMAANDGEVGVSSTGDLEVRLMIPDLIRLSGLQDIDLGTYSGDGQDLTGSSTACVRRNSAGSYSITGTSANGSYQMVSGSESIPYTVTWGGAVLVYNTPLINQVADSGSLNSCPDVQDRLEITVQGSDMDAVPSGAYTDTLILMVAPE